MELMIVSDIMLNKSGHTILTGMLLLKEFYRKTEIERTFGERVNVSSSDGHQVIADVKGISVSQTMSGRWQVSLAIDYPGGFASVALGSVVTTLRTF